MINVGRLGARRVLAVCAIVLLVVTAGCAGLGSPEENNTDAGEDLNSSDTDDTDDTDETGDSGPSDDTESRDRGEFENLDPVDADVTAEGLLNDSLSTLESVTEYRLEQNITTTQLQNNQELTSELRQTVRVNRTEQRAFVDGVTESSAQTVNLTQYLLNGSLYQSNEQIAQQYGTEWLRTDFNGSYDRAFRQFDAVAQLELLFGNATGTVEGQTTLNGEQVYAISATVDADTLVEARPGITGVEQYNINVWLSAETGLPAQVAENSTVTVSTARADITQRTNSLLRYHYEAVEIILPEAAKDAPTTEEVTGQ